VDVQVAAVLAEVEEHDPGHLHRVAARVAEVPGDERSRLETALASGFAYVGEREPESPVGAIAVANGLAAEPPVVEQGEVPEPQITPALAAMFGIEDNASTEPSARAIGGWSEQSGRAEKYVGKFLQDAGLSESVVAEREFYLKIDNEPFQSLSVERRGDRLTLALLGEEEGEAFRDREVTLQLGNDGKLDFLEASVNGQKVQGDSDTGDYTFGYAFAIAINDDDASFAEAAREAALAAAEESESEEAFAPASLPAPETEETESEEALEQHPLLEPEPESAPATQAPEASSDRPDYSATLAILRDRAQQLPEEERDRVLATLEEVAQRAQTATEAEAEPNETIAASELTRAVVAQTDSQLDRELATTSSEPETPTVQEFRDWYGAARALGKAQKYLDRIQQLGTEAKEGNFEEFSETAARYMQTDLEQAREQIGLAQDIAGNVRQFMRAAEQAGIVRDDGSGQLQVEGRNYLVTQTEQGFEVTGKQSGAILSVASERECDRVVRASGLASEDRDRWEPSVSTWN